MEKDAVKHYKTAWTKTQKIYTVMPQCLIKLQKGILKKPMATIE